MTGSAVFFTQIVGLSAAQVGLGLTIAGIASFIAAYPMGKAGGPVRAKRCWAVSAAGQASLFTLWPFIDSFTGYVAMAVTMEVVGSLGGAAHGAYTIDVLPPDERVMSRAYMYSALNVGFTLGALIGGVALAFDSNTILEAMPWFTAVAFLVNAAAILRLPNASHDERTRRSARSSCPARTAAQLRLDEQHLLPRRALDQPGPAQHRHPALAGREDRRSPRPAGVPVRHQHGHVHLPADGCRPRGQGRHDRAARHQVLHRLLRRLVPDHALHPRHRRLGHHRARLAGSRHGHRCGALSLGGELVVRGRADGPAPPWGVPRRRRAEQHPGPGLGAGALHVPRDRVEQAGLAGDRRDRGRRLRRPAPFGAGRAGLPRAARPAPEQEDVDPLDAAAPPLGPPSLLEDPPLSPSLDGSGPATSPTAQRT